MNYPKHRRLNNNTATLSKPFRSPLKVTKPQQHTARPSINTNHDGRGEKKRQVETVSNDIRSSPSSDDTTQARKDYAALSQQLRQRRQDLDILQRAINIHAADQQNTLDGLIARWQTIARDAANEVFEATDAQIKDMGGLQALNQADDQEVKPSYAEHTELEAKVSSNYLFPRLMLLTVAESQYNMVVMLCHLNIDPELLDFDLETEQWRC